MDQWLGMSLSDEGRKRTVKMVKKELRIPMIWRFMIKLLVWRMNAQDFLISHFENKLREILFLN